MQVGLQVVVLVVCGVWQQSWMKQCAGLSDEEARAPFEIRQRALE